MSNNSISGFITFDNKALERHLLKQSKDIVSAADKALSQIAEITANYAKRNIQRGARSGRLYKRGGKIGQRSRAGEWPKTDTGLLVSTINNQKLKPLKYEVGSALRYSIWLEEGTQYMAPRPWLTRAFNENYSVFDKILSNAIKGAL